MRRVVVTGLGGVCPIGNDIETIWKNALAGKSGVGAVTRFDATEFGCRIAAEVKDFDVTPYMPAKEARRFDRFIHFGIAAAFQAIKDSGLDPEKENLRRIGCAVGSGIGGIPMIMDNHETLLDRGPRRVSPFLIPGCIINMVSGQLAIMTGFKGPNMAHVSACSTGLHSIGEAAWMIKRGDADVMIAGGTDAPICGLPMAGFDSMHAMSRRNDEPQKASRPFDKDRDGFVFGEGAGVLVLEEYEHALARGAKIYAELVGYGLTADAHHITTPNTEGPAYCMRMAIAQAGINPRDIDYLNAHGTSTVLGDVNETKAIKEVFGEHAKNLLISSSKSMIGHLFGGAGGMESVLTVLALHHQVVAPTINLDNPDPECDLDYCANTAREKTIRYAMKNSFGFGGTNGSLIFKKLD
ncbi:beta-ketoacyl-ACP synthase II [Parasutterella secunda]|uniref:3-oxoacyl-[acyl-carrier-protein] synthase 2 n=1 Tax=Parasutterella secunda TaxID=626947 RepID=A0ABS2GS37_9BURK|nr:beta-ketoacyl-ACP synthase II [Parasutterella secunda]MBM6928655.1 beta-ketoacyl-ACP synthase II [Parasutterella secunda]